MKGKSGTIAKGARVVVRIHDSPHNGDTGVVLSAAGERYLVKMDDDYGRTVSYYRDELVVRPDESDREQLRVGDVVSTFTSTLGGGTGRKVVGTVTAIGAGGAEIRLRGGGGYIRASFANIYRKGKALGEPPSSKPFQPESYR